MKKIRNLQQLERIKGELFVNVICPNCKNILTSLVPDAEQILKEEKCMICEDPDEHIYNIIELPKPLSERQVIEKLSKITLLNEADVIS